MNLPALCRLQLHHNPILALPQHGWYGMSALFRVSFYGCKLHGELPDELCEFLATSATNGTKRLANLELNEYDHCEIDHLFGQFPKLKDNIRI